MLDRDRRGEAAKLLRFAATCFRPGESHGADDQGAAGAERDRALARELADALEAEPEIPGTAEEWAAYEEQVDAIMHIAHLRSTLKREARLRAAMTAERDEAREALREFTDMSLFGDDRRHDLLAAVRRAAVLQGVERTHALVPVAALGRLQEVLEHTRRDADYVFEDVGNWIYACEAAARGERVEWPS